MAAEQERTGANLAARAKLTFSLRRSVPLRPYAHVTDKIINVGPGIKNDFRPLSQSLGGYSKAWHVIRLGYPEFGGF
jgi:hypothetical protein